MLKRKLDEMGYELEIRKTSDTSKKKRASTAAKTAAMNRCVFDDHDDSKGLEFCGAHLIDKTALLQDRWGAKAAFEAIKKVDVSLNSLVLFMRKSLETTLDGGFWWLEPSPLRIHVRFDVLQGTALTGSIWIPNNNPEDSAVFVRGKKKTYQLLLPGLKALHGRVSCSEPTLPPELLSFLKARSLACAAATSPADETKAGSGADDDDDLGGQGYDDNEGGGGGAGGEFRERDDHDGDTDTGNEGDNQPRHSGDAGQTKLLGEVLRLDLLPPQNVTEFTINFELQGTLVWKTRTRVLLARRRAHEDAPVVVKFTMPDMEWYDNPDSFTLDGAKQELARCSQLGGRHFVVPLLDSVLFEGCGAVALVFPAVVCRDHFSLISASALLTRKCMWQLLQVV